MSYKTEMIPGATPGWIDTGWACGGIEVLDGVVVGGAPIFRKFYGQRAKDLQKRYKVVNLRKWRKRK